MTALDAIYRLIQLATFGALFWLMGKAIRRRQSAMNAEGREIFRAFYWLVAAMLIAILIGAGLRVQINWGGVLVLAAAGNCVYALRRRSS